MTARKHLGACPAAWTSHRGTAGSGCGRACALIRRARSDPLQANAAASPYGNALVEVAQKTNSLEAVHADVDALATILKDNEVGAGPWRRLASPSAAACGPQHPASGRVSDSIAAGAWPQSAQHAPAHDALQHECIAVSKAAALRGEC